uniref:electroneutral sodium bicarbonate exchanger 1-like n=1 Tax=Myxine glutinosa TaxID=7769 RepID=UPI00358DD9C6
MWSDSGTDTLLQVSTDSRPDEDVVVDRGGMRAICTTNFEKEELEAHHAVFVGVHLPRDRRSHRRHRHHRHQHHSQPKDSEPSNEGGDNPAYDTPSQRVQFILGMEDEDEEHVPHELFTEMDELCAQDGQNGEWKETARWLKFEEDVEDGGERWSKPYVATLSLHSLFELRSCLKNGTVILDLKASSIEEITDFVLEQQVATGKLEASARELARETLLRKHRHQTERTLTERLPIVRSFAEIGRKHSDPHLPDKPGMYLVSSQPCRTCAEHKNNLRVVDVTCVDLNFMRKIPPGAETSSVLVGGVDFLEKPVIAFVRLSPAVLISGLTQVPIPTRFIFILLGPASKAQQYHEIGRSMATLMSDEIFHDVAYKAKENGDLLAGIDEFLDQVMVLPPGEWDPSIRIEPPKSVPSQDKRKNPLFPNGLPPGPADDRQEAHTFGPELRRTGRLFGGLVLDVKRKTLWYVSDFRDAFSLQCVASFLFLYCACMSPVITFGGLLGEATEGHISAIESLFGASVAGMVYALFSGQPLTILGSTGPVLVFEKILFKFCKDYGIAYLSLRACIGLWTAFYCILLVALDASSLVCSITRFTEEAFASLICIIFIYEALEKLVHLGEVYAVNPANNLDQLTNYRCTCVAPSLPSNHTLQLWDKWNVTSSSFTWSNLTVSECRSLHGEFVGTACGHHGPYVPDVLFWSVILFFSTFLLSTFLKEFKTMRYFPTKVRAIVSDFAVFLTILIMLTTDHLLGIPSPKLQVPSVFKPTRDDRGWIVDPIGPNPWWTFPAAAIPALLCTILIFMDQQITSLIINRKENKLKKGCGYHLDLLCVSIMLGICSVMGLPWFVAATVLSISHVTSLKVESECSAPGEQPKFLGIREQRVTGLMIFLLMGCSVFMTSVLQFIPMPVLYGVFLYMGVSSLKGIQFYDRLKLFAMPAKHQPDFIYLRHVPLRKAHLFTAIQLSCLALLWAIKVSPAAVVFPMMVVALVFVRKLMYLCFSKRELSWLDDVMPESKKKTIDDAKRAEEEEAGILESIPPNTLRLSIKERKVFNVPVADNTYITTASTSPSNLPRRTSVRVATTVTISPPSP